MTTAAPRDASVADRQAVFLSGALLGIGWIVFAVVSRFHPAGVDPNNHRASFTQYAQSSSWIAVHLGVFVGVALIVAGLVVLFYALNLRQRMPGLVARLGIVSAGVALGLAALDGLVDGIALKRAVDAWVAAPDTEKVARFAGAEVVRWLEEASISYQDFLLGITLILLALLIIWTARVPRPIGYLMAVGGFSYLVAGWIVGESGFAPQGSTPTLIPQYLTPIWSIYLLIVAWRMPSSAVGRSST